MSSLPKMTVGFYPVGFCLVGFVPVRFYPFPVHVTSNFKKDRINSNREKVATLKVWFGLMLNDPVNNFSVMLGRSHRFLGITSIFFLFIFFFLGGGVNMSCSRTKQGGPSGARTPDLWIRIRGVNHQATRPLRRSRAACFLASEPIWSIFWLSSVVSLHLVFSNYNINYMTYELFIKMRVSYYYYKLLLHEKE